MNPLHKTSTNVQYSNGNLTFSPNSSWSETTFTRNNMVIPKDKKIYFEVHVDVQNGDYFMWGFSAINALPTTAQSGGTGTIIMYNGSTRINGTRTDGAGTSFSQGAIVQAAIDGSNNKVWFGVNNTWEISGDPANGTNEIGTITTNDTVGYDITAVFNQNSASTITVNFGQDSTFGGQVSAGGNADDNGFGDFKYAPPSGFLALCSANLSISDDIDPAQTDDDYPSKQFNAITFTGTGSSTTISGLGFQPDLIWAKRRDGSRRNYLVDSNRGFTKYLHSDGNYSEGTSSDGVTSANSDGFVIGGSLDYINASSNTYVAWCWRANGGTTASNSDGTGTSTVQANTKAGFSIVQFPNYSGDTTFGHGLTKAPNFIIAKLTASSSNWPTYHDAYSSGKCCFLNLQNAEATSTHFAHSGTGNPVSATTFGMGASFAGSGAGIAYCFHDVEGYSKFGSYEGNDNTDGPFVYTGFRPRLLVIKGVDEAYSWYVFDSARNPFNLVDKHLRWSESDAEATESTGARRVDFYGTGFKIKASAASLNGSGDTYAYMCWGDIPAKYNNAF